MDPFSIAMIVMSAIAGIGSIISTAVANHKNIKLAEETREDQQDFAAEQATISHERTQELYWKLYSPESKVKQLKSAGLSPGLMYGMGGTGGSSSTPGAQAAMPNTAAPYVNPIVDSQMMSTLLSSMNSVAEQKKTKAETESTWAGIDKIEADIEKTKTEIGLIEEQTNTQVITQQQMKLENDLLEIDKKWKDANYEQSIELTKQQKDTLKASMDKTLKEIDLLKIDEKNKQALIDAELKIMAQNILESNARISKMLSEKALNEAKTEVEKKEIDRMTAEINKMVAETDLTKVKIGIEKINEMWLNMEKTMDLLEQITSGKWWQAALKMMGGQLSALVNVTAGTARIISKMIKGEEKSGDGSK